ncbi:hypothetical protein PFISCL1PPCAC_11536, partial [Pristionchus fissidentatus]
PVPSAMQQPSGPVGGVKDRIKSVIDPKYLLIYLIISGVLLSSLLISAVVNDEFEGVCLPVPPMTIHYGLSAFIDFESYDKRMQEIEDSILDKVNKGEIEKAASKMDFSEVLPKFSERRSWSQAVSVVLIFSAVFEIFTSVMAVVMIIKPALRKFLPFGIIGIGVLNIIFLGLSMGLWNSHSSAFKMPDFTQNKKHSSVLPYNVYGSSYKQIAASTFFNIVNMIVAGMVFFLG